MKINIASVLKSDGASIPFSGSVELGEVDFMGNTLLFKEPVSVKGVVTAIGGTIEIEADIWGEYTTACSRCGEEARLKLETKLAERVEDDFSDADEECLLLSGTILDITGALQACIFGELPMQYLCKEDCKGLCPVCGTNLNEKECNCDTTVYDPRFDIFRKLQQRGVENGSSEEENF